MSLLSYREYAHPPRTFVLESTRHVDLSCSRACSSSFSSVRTPSSLQIIAPSLVPPNRFGAAAVLCFLSTFCCLDLSESIRGSLLESGYDNQFFVFEYLLQKLNLDLVQRFACCAAPTADRHRPDCISRANCAARRRIARLCLLRGRSANGR